MAENRQYDHEYKVQAVKLAKEIGQAKAAKELGVPKNTMYGWVRANRLGNLDLGAGSQTPQSAMTLNEELLKLRRQVKELEKENRRLKKENDFLEETSAFFCRVLHVSRQGFYQYLANKDCPWKYQPLADAMKEILTEDECNDTYGRIRMYQALTLKQPENVNIPSERTVYRIMEEIGISHQPRRKPNGITKADREARKSDDLLKRDFHAEEPLTKCVTDITEIKASDGKLYVSAVFDCFDSSVVGLAMDTNMKAPLCVQTLENTFNAYPGIRGAIIHSDRGSQYTSQLYRDAVRQYGIQQSMNSAGGRCHDNARCESMWARMKSELLYDRYDTEKMTTEELRAIIWRYFISYWNNRTISWVGQKENQRSILWLFFCLTYSLRCLRYDSQFRIIKKASN